MDREERAALNQIRDGLRADLEVGGGALLHVFNVHLGTALLERRHQGRKLIAPELLADVTLEHPRLVLGLANSATPPRP